MPIVKNIVKSEAVVNPNETQVNDISNVSVDEESLGATNANLKRSKTKKDKELVSKPRKPVC